MKFYPQDWRADEKLRLCSLAARGLWIEMLALMHRSERYGQLLISGRVPTDGQLAVQVGASPDEVIAMLAELSDAGVFSRAASGAIYSRRMTRDHKKAENARKNGKKGGNPSLGNKRGISASDKGRLSSPLNLEARGQRPEEANASPREVSGLMIELSQIASIVPPDPSIRFDKHKAELDMVEGWVAAGADPALIRDTLTQRCANLRTSPRSLAFFDKPIREAVEQRKAAGSHVDATTDSIMNRVLGRSAA
jgi:hypothetical protein